MRLLDSISHFIRTGGAAGAGADFWDGPLGYLIWLGFLLLPLTSGEPLRWWPTAAAIGVFLPIYLWSFQKSGPVLWICRGAMFLIGVWVFPHNTFAHTFFIYAGLPSPRAKIRESVVLMLVTIGAAFGYFYWRDLSGLYYGLVAFIVLGIGTVTLAARISRASLAVLAGKDAEIARLAKIAERERIARDLHDLLGHTLSLIAIKAELAHKVVGLDGARAAAEMAEVAQVARKALAEVRQAIVGLRSIALLDAVRAVNATLRAAGLEVTQHIDTLPALSAAQEHALAQALLEAATNIVRHAQASTVSIRMVHRADQLILEIQDNGRGGQIVWGNGLQGMRERLNTLNSTLTLTPCEPGLLISMRLALDPSHPQ